MESATVFIIGMLFFPLLFGAVMASAYQSIEEFIARLTRYLRW